MNHAQIWSDKASKIQSVDKNDVSDDLWKLQCDYPHTIVALTDNGEHIGARRIFKDHSYCDVLLTKPGQIFCGRLVGGVNGKGLYK